MPSAATMAIAYEGRRRYVARYLLSVGKDSRTEDRRYRLIVDVLVALAYADLPTEEIELPSEAA